MFSFLKKPIKRTILYYPQMKINHPQWLRQMVLYWDEVGSIVPERFTRTILGNGELKILAENGQYRVFNPDSYVYENDDLANEFMSILNSSMLNKSLEPPRESYIDSQKFNPMLLKYLLESGLAHRHDDWVKIPQRYGWLYMALLAKYMANDDDSAITVPGTDYASYLNAVFSANSNKESLSGLAVSITGMLPTPRRDVPIEDVINFKIKRQAELQRLREVILKNQDKLKNAKEKNELIDITDRFVSVIKNEVEEIDKLFSDAKIPIVLGALETILKIETPTLLAGLATIGTVPISLTIAGAIVAGGLSLRKYQLDVRNEQHQKLAANSFSYLYHAQQEGIL